MNAQQISCIQRYIDENPTLSNKALSAVIVEKSNTFKGYSEGSVANYIGQVKKLPKKVVSTQPGHIGDVFGKPQVSNGTKPTNIIREEAEAPKPVVKYISIMEGENSNKDGMRNLLVDGLKLSAADADDILDEMFEPFIAVVNAEDADDIYAEAFGYGYIVNWAHRLELNDYQEFIKDELLKQLVNLFNLDVSERDLTTYTIENFGIADTQQLVQGISDALDLGLQTNQLKYKKTKTFPELIFHISNDLITSENELYEKDMEAESTVEESAPTMGDSTPDLPPHYDILVVSVKDEAFKFNYSRYVNVLHKDALPGIIVFGNEARSAGLDEQNYIDAVHGGIGGEFTNAVTNGGIAEAYALYDGIDAAIASVINNCPDLTKFDVNLTIVTERGVDFGSVHISKESIAELIQKVKSRFGWSINLLCRERSAKEVAIELGIDTSNAVNYTYGSEAMDFLVRGRQNRNEKLIAGTVQSFNYFQW